MNLGKLGQALTAREVFDLIQDELEQVEKKITVESVASVDAVTAACVEGRFMDASEALAFGLVDEIARSKRSPIRSLPGLG